MRWVAAGSVVLAVLLVVAIVLVIRKKENDALAESSRAAREEQLLQESIALAEEESIAAEAASRMQLSLCGDEAVIMAVEEYFEARLAADSTRLFELFGRNSVSPEEELDQKLAAQASWIQSYEDITVYDAPGTEDDELFCLVTYTIDFRRTDEPAPGIMYFFAKKAADGSVTIEENLFKDQVDYAEKVLATDTASELIENVNEDLRSALSENSTLALIYVSFANGEIYLEQGIDTDREQIVDFLDPAASVLVDEDTLADIAAEAEEMQAKEASLAEELESAAAGGQ